MQHSQYVQPQVGGGGGGVCVGAKVDDDECDKRTNRPRRTCDDERTTNDECDGQTSADAYGRLASMRASRPDNRIYDTSDL